MYVGIVHTAAAAELVWGYIRGISGATDTTRTTSHRESHSSVPVSCPPAKKGPPRRRKPLTTNLARVNMVRARVFESHVLIFLLCVAAVLGTT